MKQWGYVTKYLLILPCKINFLIFELRTLTVHVINNSKKYISQNFNNIIKDNIAIGNESVKNILQIFIDIKLPGNFCYLTSYSLNFQNFIN